MVELQSINVSSRSYKEQLIDIDLQAIAQEVNNISPNPLSYQVYTALLTQSGGDNILSLNDSILTIGVTYIINNNDEATSDFTNVGAPDNHVGTAFVASKELPNSWGTTNSAELVYNEGAPIVTVLENTIGDIWFTYTDIGQYLALSNDAFPSNKTGCFIGGTTRQSNCPSFIANSLPDYDHLAGKGVYIVSSGVESAPDYYTDDALSNTMLEIRVYN